MANLLQLLSGGLAQARQISGVIDALLGASDAAAARSAIGIQPHYVGESSQTSLPVTLSGGLWTDDRGWLWIPPTGQSMGSATSGATVANDKLERLFLALWPHLNLATPGYSIAGGAGASAQADWDANKALTIPDYRGRVGAQTGQGGGLMNRALGATWGEEEHTQTEAEMVAHNHTGPNSGESGTAESLLDNSKLTELGVNRPVVDTTGRRWAIGFMAVAGSGDPFNVTPPSYSANVFWFLGEKA